MKTEKTAVKKPKKAIKFETLLTRANKCMENYRKQMEDDGCSGGLSNLTVAHRILLLYILIYDGYLAGAGSADRFGARCGRLQEMAGCGRLQKMASSALDQLSDDEKAAIEQSDSEVIPEGEALNKIIEYLLSSPKHLPREPRGVKSRMNELIGQRDKTLRRIGALKKIAPTSEELELQRKESAQLGKHITWAAKAAKGFKKNTLQVLTGQGRRECCENCKSENSFLVVKSQNTQGRAYAVCRYCGAEAVIQY